MLKFLENYEFITSWILLPVEFIFLGLMWWEFKYIRKEQQEKKDKEANRQLAEIIKFFNLQYFSIWCKIYCPLAFLHQSLNMENKDLEYFKSQYAIKTSNFKDELERIEYTKTLIRDTKNKIYTICKKINRNRDKDKCIERLLIKQYKYRYAKNKKITKKEEITIKNILKKFIFELDNKLFISSTASGMQEEMYNNKNDAHEKYEKYVLNPPHLRPERARHMNIDYKELEKIYTNILYGYGK